MAKRVQDMKPPRPDNVLLWLKRNIAEQKTSLSRDCEGNE